MLKGWHFGDQEWRKPRVRKKEEKGRRKKERKERGKKERKKERRERKGKKEGKKERKKAHTTRARIFVCEFHIFSFEIKCFS